MFVVMEVSTWGLGNARTTYELISPEEGFDSLTDARNWCYKEDLCDVIIFEFKEYIE